MTNTLETLIDKMSLDEAMHRILSALDRCDWISYRAGFMENVEFDFRDHKAAPAEANDIIQGIDKVIATQRSVMEGLDVAQHYVTNAFHTIDGDHAITNCYLYAEHFLTNALGDRSVTLGGTYEVHWQRTGDSWKARKWRFAHPWMRGNPMLYRLAKDVTSAKG